MAPKQTNKQIHPRVADFLATRLLPLHPRLPPIFQHALTTPTIHLTPTHLLPAAAALGLALLYTSGACVPERWAKHGLTPVWANDVEDSDSPEEEGGRHGRTLEGEVARLLRGQASVAEAFEVEYRGMVPLLRRKKAELARASRGGRRAATAAGGSSMRRGL